jgi:hypothetical protein
MSGLSSGNDCKQYQVKNSGTAMADGTPIYKLVNKEDGAKKMVMICIKRKLSDESEMEMANLA